jgi:pyruvate/2-oxoacid:ferredoxin oxidoreductase beta subunit
MNTGIQVSSATPRYTWTGTTPGGNTRRKKNIMDIMAAHRIPYAATASIGFPEDLMAKVEKAKGVRGTRFIHILSPCNTGWRIGEDQAPLLATLSVETNVFPLFEIHDGIRHVINHEPRRLPVKDYLRLQGRYRHLTEEQIQEMQSEVDRSWKLLSMKASAEVC